ncbi:MAG: hypothetical protein SFU87_20875 [Chitinophagaceae bacterium]|nr:hypothetical protein [Chitinophagaceae bacterium]
MRIVSLLLLIVFMANNGLGQQPVKKEIKKPVPDQVPSKNQMQGQLAEAITELNTQIADLEKQLAEAIAKKEDEQTIKDLRDQIAMLKKQVEMMRGVGKTVSGISEKTFQQAGEKEPLVPKKDVARINMLPDKILTKEELTLFIKQVHRQVEIMIPAEEKTEALTIYNETKNKHNSAVITGNTASSLWMIGHSEKAIYIMGRACLDDMDNIDNLNNYAAFLTMTGAEQAALPILQYLNDLFPKNSTILNNIGQAWFGLGEVNKAKENLEGATLLDPNHSMANTALADISLSEGNSQRTISFLKAALKETYDPDKEAQLSSLGYTITFADLPPLNYPMKNDPFGLIPFIESLPEDIQTNVNDMTPALKLKSYGKGVLNLKNLLENVRKELQKKQEQSAKKMAENAQYRTEIFEALSPGYTLGAAATRIRVKKVQPVQVTGSIDDDPVEKIIASCQKYWFDSVVTPIKKLLHTKIDAATGDCASFDAATNAFLQKRNEIYSRGVRHIKKAFIRNSRKLTEWIKIMLYGSGLDQPPRGIGDLTYLLIGEMERTKGKSIIQNDAYRDILRFVENASETFQNEYVSQCDKQKQILDPKADDLVPLGKTKVECEFKKKVEPSGYYKFELVCNTIVEKTDPKLKKRKSKNRQGAAKSATPRGQISSRLPLLSGPSAYLNDYEMEFIKEKPAPLNAEDKDPSQFSLEYDRWGNLIGFNLQLNKEGTALADPDSVESGIESRWSWNAAGSATKGFLNKLVIK